ncbi:MAG TPA: peptidase [Cryomorphaceae bacterium]|nr:peptidase [Owenweeksia sp.]MBF98137.1 peptidase [Owenweeksia sp.]HAD97043.1 peptidase [Cryomorphaceae bacterium]HBF20248.1 peptidase [Cryomorphaceae bacterium]|tara:strand:+ start:245 stop:1732 length:1488 start_codon:yes stop_codon:yes gene_type:complete
MENISKLLALASLILLISCKSDPEKSEWKEVYPLSKPQMIEDFNVFKNIFQQANAGLNKYRSKNQVDSVFEANRTRIKDGMSYRDFYNIIWNVIDYTGSCHNELAYPDSLDNYLSKQEIFFPIPLTYLEGKIYTNLEYGGVRAGSEIVSVNAIQANKFANSIARYVSTDGLNTTGKYKKIETDWLPFYVYLALEAQSQFTITYKTGNSNVLKKVTVPATTYNEFYTDYAKRYSKELELKMERDYSYAFLDILNTGLLEVHTFAMGGPETHGHHKYAVFLDSVFSMLQTQKVERLIVDVRGNGGGNDPNDLLLYSYLTQREFRENTTAYTLFQEIPFQEYYVYDDVEELTSDLKREHSILKGGKYYQNDTFNEIWKPQAKAFQGTIVLLIDPYVASAGSLFASLVKSDENTIVIGEETLGGYYGHTGHIPVTYELPNSKLRLTFSIVDLEQDVRKLPDQKFGDGVKPDFEVLQSHEDFIKHRDTQLNFAIEKIRRL